MGGEGDPLPVVLLGVLQLVLVGGDLLLEGSLTPAPSHWSLAGGIRNREFKLGYFLRETFVTTTIPTT